MDKNNDIFPHVPEVIQELRNVIRDESKAISDYNRFLKMSGFTNADKVIIQELIDDEKDHLVLLTAMLQDHTQVDYKGYGDSPFESDESLTESKSLDDFVVDNIYSDEAESMIYEIERITGKRIDEISISDYDGDIDEDSTHKSFNRSGAVVYGKDNKAIIEFSDGDKYLAI